jgi:hypothetical protein
MSKVALSGLALGAAMAVGAAQAEPLTLSADQMDEVTAAGTGFAQFDAVLSKDINVKKDVNIQKEVQKFQDVFVFGLFGEADAFQLPRRIRLRLPGDNRNVHRRGVRLRRNLSGASYLSVAIRSRDEWVRDLHRQRHRRRVSRDRVQKGSSRPREKLTTKAPCLGHGAASSRRWCVVTARNSVKAGLTQWGHPNREIGSELVQLKRNEGRTRAVELWWQRPDGSGRNASGRRRAAAH